MGFLFLRKDEVLKYHARSLELFGGTRGVRGEGALESALAAAENREHYETLASPPARRPTPTTCRRPTPSLTATSAWRLPSQKSFWE